MPSADQHLNMWMWMTITIVSMPNTQNEGFTKIVKASVKLAQNKVPAKRRCGVVA